MFQCVAALVLALHGVVHLIGFVSPWRIAALEGFAYRTTVLGGAQDVGDGGVRLIGLVWLGLAFGFVAAAYGVWRRKPWAVGLTGVFAIVSLIVSIAGVPETAAGVAIDLLILGTVAYTTFHKSRSLGRTEGSMP
jgi:hypothetical protein